MKLHHLGHESFLAPVHWDEEGWPVVGTNGRIALAMEGPILPSVIWPAPAARDDFDAPTLGVDWNFLRWPRPEDWSLAARAGYVRLNGNDKSLDDGTGAAFLGRRQAHARWHVTTLFDFTPIADGQEAGLVVWMNQGPPL